MHLHHSCRGIPHCPPENLGQLQVPSGHVQGRQRVLPHPSQQSLQERSRWRGGVAGLTQPNRSEADTECLDEYWHHRSISRQLSNEVLFRLAVQCSKLSYSCPIKFCFDTMSNEILFCQLSNKIFYISSPLPYFDNCPMKFSFDSCPLKLQSTVTHWLMSSKVDRQAGLQWGSRRSSDCWTAEINDEGLNEWKSSSSQWLGISLHSSR